MNNNPKKDIGGLSLGDWILALADYANGSIENDRLHAGLLIIKKNTGNLITAKYTPGCGMYSIDVKKSVEELVRSGLLKRNCNESRIFITLTEEGRRKSREVLEVIKNSEEWKILRGFFELVSKGKDLALFGMVATLYPDYYKA